MLQPIVSVIIPCFNEARSIQALLQALYDQSFPRTNLEILIADGLSTDETREVITQFQVTHPDMLILIVDNPKRIIPAGLNRAIELAQGEYIVRLDAHSVPYPDYIERCIEAITSGLGDNVGGVWEILPGADGWVPESIALAAAHPLGVGNALYRLGGKPQLVDTVPFGSFHRSLIEKVGGFNEQLLTNEDYEFNVRIKKSGGKIWFDPQIRSRYYARSSYVNLARQYWRYGFWKLRMLRKYPETIRWRQFIPPLFALSIPLLVFLGFVHPIFYKILVVEISIYLGVLLIVGLQSAGKNQKFLYSLGVPLAIIVMHLTWGYSFLWSLIIPYELD